MSTSKKRRVDPSAPDLFLSYNHTDREAVLVVRRRLAERGISTYIDSDDLPIGIPWPIALYNALQEVRAVAVFIGKAGLGSWQMREVSLSLDRQVREEECSYRFPVIPVLLPGADLEGVLGFLLLNTWIDLRNGLNAAETLDELARAIKPASGRVGKRQSRSRVPPPACGINSDP
jgi:hypothetical protein